MEMIEAMKIVKICVMMLLPISIIGMFIYLIYINSKVSITNDEDVNEKDVYNQRNDEGYDCEYAGFN